MLSLACSSVRRTTKSLHGVGYVPKGGSRTVKQKTGQLRVLALAVPLMAVCMLGCGKTKFKVVPVEGKLVFADGTPLPAGTSIRLDPVAGEAGTATGTIDATGAFKLTHVSGRTGAEVGKYTVVLIPPKEGTAEFQKLVPKDYYEGSGALVADIQEGMKPLELQVPKIGTRR